MKRFALMISLLLSILCMTQAKDRIVERPPFLAQSSSSIEIDKIVMSDTVTTVYIKAFYRPKYWIKIATGSVLKDNNGNLYPVRKGIGITLDKEFWMPESGEAEFQLTFPPIPQNVTPTSRVSIQASDNCLKTLQSPKQTIKRRCPNQSLNTPKQFSKEESLTTKKGCPTKAVFIFKM